MKAITIVAALMHGWYGVALISAPQAAHITSLAGITRAAELLPGGTYILAVLLIVASAMALVAASEHCHSRLKSYWLLSGQQIVLTFSFLEAMSAALGGRYPDGYTPEISPHLFIFTDQLAVICLAVVHGWFFCLSINEDRRRWA